MPNLSGQRVLSFDIESDGFFEVGSAGQREITVVAGGRTGLGDTQSNGPRNFHTGRSLSSLLVGVRSEATRRHDPITQEERDSIDRNLETTTSHFSDQTVGESYRFENSANKCPCCGSNLKLLDYVRNMRACSDEICDFQINGTEFSDTFTTTTDGRTFVYDNNGNIRIALGRL